MADFDDERPIYWDRAFWTPLLTLIGVVFIYADVLPEAQWDDIVVIVLAVLSTLFGWDSSAQRADLEVLTSDLEKLVRDVMEYEQDHDGNMPTLN